MDSGKRADYGKGVASDFLVIIINCDDSLFKGKVEHIKTGQVQSFNDFFEMMLLIQKQLDEQNFPQSETELRVFDKKD